MSDGTISRIQELVRKMRRDWVRLSLSPPAVIILEDHDQGMSLLCELKETNRLVYQPGAWGTPVEHPDGSVWMEIEIEGMKVRWPAMQYAKHGGGYTFG